MFLYSGFIIGVNKVGAQSSDGNTAKKTTYDPHFLWTVSVGATNDETGAAYAGLNLAMRAPDNLKSFRKPNGKEVNESDLYWSVDVTSLGGARVTTSGSGSDIAIPRIASYSVKEFYFVKRCGELKNTKCGDTWLGFDNTYKITAKLYYKENLGSGGMGGGGVIGDQGTIGQYTETVNIGPPPLGSSGTSDSQNCSVKNLKWWPTSTENKIYFTWTKVPDACKDNAVKITRGDGSVLYEDFSLRNSSIEDSSAKSGKYVFMSHTTSDPDTGKSEINVDLKKAVLNTSEGPKSPGDDPTDVGSGSAFAGEGKCSCPLISLGPMGYALCEAQCYILNMMAAAIGKMISEILIPSLGI